MIKTFKNNSLIYMVKPTEEEVVSIQKQTNIDSNIIKKILDKHESARVEVKEDNTLIVLSIPLKKDTSFKTVPLGIILFKDFTVVLINNEEMGKNILKKLNNISLNGNILFDIFLLITSHYQTILNQMQALIEIKEKNLLKASNNDLKELLEIQKGLVYFIKALNSNEVVFEKLNINNNFDDIIIENKQAINMASLYQELLKSIMDSYETIISNNLNKTMKFLTGITIVFTIPTMVSSFMGMNVKLGYFNDGDLAFPILVLISILLSLIVAYIFKKKNWL